MKILILFGVSLLFFSCNRSSDSNIPEEIADEIKQTFPLFNRVDIDSTYIDEGKSIQFSEGVIPTDSVAVQVAQPSLFHIYGKGRIEAQQPYEVALNDSVWIIQGDYRSINNNMLRGTFYIELNKMTGTVVKLVHTK